jgi:cellulose synthase/poly-beta-1,6-N-acetylglucosamine synthase-like glycosyltransferase
MFVKTVSIYLTLVIFGFLFYFLILSIIIVKKYPTISNSKPFPKKAPTVAVVTYAFNNFQPILLTVERLKKLKYPIPFTVYVITDGTCKFLDKVPGVKQIILPKKYFLKSDVNLKSRIINLGLKYIKEENIFQVDGDTIPNKDVLMKLTGTLREEIVMAIGSVGVTNTNNFIEKIQVVEYNFGFGFPRMVMTAMNSLDIGTGALCLYKRKIFDEVGGYDVNNITEDKEIVYKFIENGYRAEFVIDAKAKTEVPKTLRGFYTQRIRWFRGGYDVTSKYIHFLFKKNLGFFSFYFVYTTSSLILGMLFVSKTIYDVLSSLILNGYYYISSLISYGFSFSDIMSINISFAPFMNSLLLLVLISITVALYFIIISFKYNNFKMEKKYIIPLIYMILVHGFILLLISIISIVYGVFGVKYKW